MTEALPYILFAVLMFGLGGAFVLADEIALRRFQRRNEPWSAERTALECASRGHPDHGNPHPGAFGSPDVCLCGDVAYPPGPDGSERMLRRHRLVAWLRRKR